MERHFGLSLEVRAADQLQRIPPSAATTAPAPLPAGNPGRASAASVGIADASPLTFLLVGDVGGVDDPNPQMVVSAAMQQASAAGPAPAFLYLVGDIVYFNGDESQYGPQFYEPYTHLTLPIVGIPGNHDGDTSNDPSRKPLDAFMANFCAPAPTLPAGANAEYGRDLQTQPYCDWTLALSELTIIGLYDNVRDGGHLYPSQIDWLVSELKAAPADRPLMLCLHHPPYSVDAFHGGSQTLGAILDAAFTSAGRAPQMVLSGHVHDYQRYTRSFGSDQITYVVAGNGGYHNLHAFAKDAAPGTEIAAGVTFAAGDDKNWGFLTLTAAAGTLSGVYTSVTRTGQATPGADSFSVRA
jgi:3',5'-cyclic AMP phosphodiesterase CpdA